MNDDLISRQAAIEALNEYFGRIGKLKRRGLNKGERAISLDVVGVIRMEPSAWIPCSERLPEVNTRCLCTYENKEGTCIDFGLYMKRGWFVSGVTAWMPLPEPYRPERGGDA